MVVAPIILVSILALLIGGWHSELVGGSPVSVKSNEARHQDELLGNVSPTPAPSHGITRRVVNETYGRVSRYFEVNQGQTDLGVKFLSRGGGYTLFLTSTEAVFRLPTVDFGLRNEEFAISDFRLPIDRLLNNEPHRYSRLGPRLRALDLWHFSQQSSIGNWQSPNPHSGFRNPQSETLRMKLVGANRNATVEGLQRIPGTSNYLIGSDPTTWRTNIPHYAKVLYREVYPGIDLVYYGNPQQLEYDFVVAPGANPGSIRLSFASVEGITVGDNGELVLEIPGAAMRLLKPRVYQEVSGVKVEIDARYRLTKQQVGIELGTYDLARALTIDPVIIYSATFGGSMGESVSGIAVDSQGNAYAAGRTLSPNFPVTPGAFHTQWAGQGSLPFITKLDTTGTAIVYSTYFGGTGDVGESIFDIAVDAGGNAFVVGSTSSSDFPVTSNAFQRQYNGGPLDAFVTKLNAAGNGLDYSTYLGGTNQDAAYGMTLDATGHAYVTGFTLSGNFPVTPAAFQSALKTSAGSSLGRDVFVAKLDLEGAALVYSTFLGGTGGDSANAIAVDSSGSAYVTGNTNSLDFPVTSGAFQQSYQDTNSAQDSFVTKLSFDGRFLTFSTYLGARDYDSVAAIAVDRDGNAYLTGSTRSSDFPVTPGAYETVFKPYFEFLIALGSGCPFVTKLNQNGSALVYSTFLTSTQTLGANDIELDSAGNAYIASGGYISKLDPSGSALRFSEYFRAGWLPLDSWYFRTGWLALDSSENIYSAGGATLKPPGRRNSSGVIVDLPILWVSLIKLSSSDSIPFFLPVVLSVPGLNGSYFTSELTLTNSGASSAPLEIEYRATVGGGSGTGVITLRPGTQQIFPDAMGFLSSLGIPVPTSGDRLGSLIIRAPKDVAVQARTTTRTGPGRAGLAYSTQPVAQALMEPVYLAGLRQNATDRSNVALLNVGSPADGDVVLRITVYPPVPSTSAAAGLFEERLAPGEFKQISGILNANGLSFTEGFVRVERISGSAPYFAYAVINDQVTSDGSFIAPTRSNALNGRPGVILPVVVATPDFASELVLTNWSGIKKTLRLEFVAETITAADSTATIAIELEPLTQRLIPDFVQFLRSQGVAGIEGNNVSYAGALFVLVDGNDAAGLFVGSRTFSLRAGERYGVFFPAVPLGATTPQETWLHGLRQDSENRTNLALVNTGEIDTTTNEFEIEIFDGSTGVKLTTLEGVSVGARRWRQINSLLADYAPGVRHAYLHIIKKFGSNPFIAYAVINDGAVPGDRTGDGAFISSSP